MADSFLLLEVGDFILLEDAVSKIILDEVSLGGVLFIPKLMLMGCG